MIQRIANSTALRRLLDTNYRVVTTFTAPKSEHCDELSAVVEELAKENPEVRFVTIDINEAGDLASQYKISIAPTLVTFKNERWVNTLASSDKHDVRQVVEELTKI